MQAHMRFSCAAKYRANSFDALKMHILNAKCCGGPFLIMFYFFTVSNLP